MKGGLSTAYCPPHAPVENTPTPPKELTTIPPHGKNGSHWFSWLLRACYRAPFTLLISNRATSIGTTNAHGMITTNQIIRTATKVAGFVLIAASLLSMSTQFADAYHFGSLSDNRGLTSDFGPWLLRLYEIILGITLICIAPSRLVYGISAVTFAAFFVVSMMKGLEGRQTCDCFGAIAVWPFYTAAIDLILLVACLAALFYLSPAVATRNRNIVSAIGISLVFLLCFSPRCGCERRSE